MFRNVESPETHVILYVNSTSIKKKNYKIKIKKSGIAGSQ